MTSFFVDNYEKKCILVSIPIRTHNSLKKTRVALNYIYRLERGCIIEKFKGDYKA